MKFKIIKYYKKRFYYLIFFISLLIINFLMKYIIKKLNLKF